VLLVLAIVFTLGYFAATLFFALLKPFLRLEPLDPSFPVGPPARSGERRGPGRRRGLPLGLPKKGGTPAGRFLRWRGDHEDVHNERGVGAAGGTSSRPPRVRSPVEGVWHVTGRSPPNGIPTMYEAFVRPDAVHTSYVVGVVWDGHESIDRAVVLRFQIPGGAPFEHSAPISSSRSKTLVAAFNSGFLMQNADGGYFTDGKSFKKFAPGRGLCGHLQERSHDGGEMGSRRGHDQSDRVGAPEFGPDRR